MFEILKGIFERIIKFLLVLIFYPMIYLFVLVFLVVLYPIALVLVLVSPENVGLKIGGKNDNSRI